MLSINPVADTVVLVPDVFVAKVRPLLITNVPLISAVVLLFKVTLKLLPVPIVSSEPAATTMSSPAAGEFLMVSVLLLEAALSVTLVLFVINNFPIVSDGTPVIVLEDPSLNRRISVLAVDDRVGVQLVLVVQEPLLAPLQVYVFWERTAEKIRIAARNRWKCFTSISFSL